MADIGADQLGVPSKHVSQAQQAHLRKQIKATVNVDATSSFSAFLAAAGF